MAPDAVSSRSVLEQIVDDARKRRGTEIMRILGIGGLDHNGAICLVEGGRIKEFLEVERVTRCKNQGIDSPDVLGMMLQRLAVAEVEHVAIADRTWCRERDWLVPWLERRFPGVSRRLYGHHDCHLTSAFATSPFSQATVVSIDGKGDGLSAVAASATRGAQPDTLISVSSAHSIGRVWWALCEFLGLPGHHSAGKAMALASYGNATFFDRLALHREVSPDGGFRFIARGEHPDLFRQVPRLAFWMSQLAGVPPARGHLEQAHKDMACSVQRLTESIVEQFVAAAVSRSGSNEVCLSGGIALNGLVNQRLLAQKVASSLYVPPFTDDRGLAVGAAALAALEVGTPLPPEEEGVSPFLGPVPALAIPEDAMFAWQASGEDALYLLAQHLEADQVVGWFEGRDEAGPRALGHRSILASPVSLGMRERLNSSIKKREWFRPFGCSVLQTRVADWFACIDDSPYMLRIVPVHPWQAPRIPSALHEDGTSRLHTVTPERSPRLARLLEIMETRGHPPLLINTSFNGPSEPIVHTVKEAMNTAYDIGLDAILVEGSLYSRRKN